MQTLPANKVWLILLLQLGLTLVLTTVLLIAGRTESVSGFTGGLAATLSNAIFAIVVFRQYKEQQPGRLVGSYYLAEFVKLAFTALIFLMAIVFIKPISIVAMLGTYLVVHLASTLFVIIFGRG